MTQISKRKIDKNKLNNIHNLFLHLFIRLYDKSEVEELLSELLTETERIMISKRLACFYLLLKGLSNEEISNALKMSTSTVSHYKYYLNRNTKITQYLSLKLNSAKFKKLFENFFDELFYGIPRKGSNWSANLRVYYKHKRKLQEPL